MGLLEAAALLVTHGASMEARDGQGRTALWHAVREEQDGIVEMLIHAGAKVYYENEDLACPTQLACKTALLKVRHFLYFYTLVFLISLNCSIMMYCAPTMGLSNSTPNYLRKIKKLFLEIKVMVLTVETIYWKINVAQERVLQRKPRKLAISCLVFVQNRFTSIFFTYLGLNLIRLGSKI